MTRITKTMLKESYNGRIYELCEMIIGFKHNEIIKMPHIITETTDIFVINHFGHLTQFTLYPSNYTGEIDINYLERNYKEISILYHNARVFIRGCK